MLRKIAALPAPAGIADIGLHTKWLRSAVTNRCFRKSKRKFRMKSLARYYRYGIAVLALILALLLAVAANAQNDALPSWNEGPAKQSIVNFVKDVTDKSGPKYVEPQDRIAAFDQDGTLWVEHPIY